MSCQSSVIVNIVWGGFTRCISLLINTNIFKLMQSLSCLCLSCSSAAGKSTFVRILQDASDEWEVIPEPIGKWCNIQNDSEDVYQVNKLQLRTDNDTHPTVCSPVRYVSVCRIWVLLRRVAGTSSRCCMTSQAAGPTHFRYLHQPAIINTWNFQVWAHPSVSTCPCVQSYACLSRVRTQLQGPSAKLQLAENPVQFYERSVYSDR